MKNFLIFGFGVAATFELAQAWSPPIVDLGYAVHQATINSSGKYPYYNFSNIRYGQAPVGSLRFSAPLAPEGRTKTVNTGQQGVICPQATPAWYESAGEFLPVYLSGRNISAFTNPPPSTSKSSNLSSLPAPDPRTSEDCLFLDVIVPEKIFNSRKGAPVLVWIYGGGYVFGDKTANGNPATLIADSFTEGKEGVIFVAMNYRLGLFGWLSGSNEVTPNAGLLDQRLALDWVEKNIHLFGGDCSRITIMGESAGGGSVMHHITSYGGKGHLSFQKAIPQSPAFDPTPPVQAAGFLSEVLGNASLIAKTTIDSPAQLRLLPFEELYIVNVIVVGLSIYSGFTFGPVIDPTPGSYVPDLPLRLLAQGKFHHVSVMVGHNSDEGLLFTPPYIQTQNEFISFVEKLFPTANASTVAYVTDILYPPIFNGSYAYTNAIERTALMLADFSITCNAYLLACTLYPSHAYLFSEPQGLHGEDIAYTFFNGDTTSSLGPVNATVATAFQQYLTSFTEHGRPEAVSFESFALYGKTDTVTNIVDPGLGVHIKDPAARAQQCAFWQAAPYYIV